MHSASGLPKACIYLLQGHIIGSVLASRAEARIGTLNRTVALTLKRVRRTLVGAVLLRIFSTQSNRQRMEIQHNLASAIGNSQAITIAYV